MANSSDIQISWSEVATTEDQIIVYEGEVEGLSLVAFKGIATIDAPLEKVASVIYDEEQKKEWMDRVHSQRRVKKLNKGKTIVYNQTSLPWPVYNREFFYEMEMKYKKENQRLEATLKHVEGYAHLQDPKSIRGVFLDSGFDLTPVEGGKKTKLEVRVMVDAKGWLPAWLVNLIQASWPENTIRGLRKQVKKVNHVDQDILDLMRD